MTIEPLRWHKTSKGSWSAYDGPLTYLARPRMGKWRIQLNGASLGTEFDSLEAAQRYVDWGGTPSRMAYDPETGEVSAAACPSLAAVANEEERRDDVPVPPPTALPLLDG